MASSVVIASGTLPASTLELSLTGLDYDEIRVWCAPDNGAVVDVQVSNDNGSTWISTGYDTQRLGATVNTFNDNDNAFLAGPTRNRFNLYNLGIAAPTMFQSSGLTSFDPTVYWGVYPVAEVHDAVKIIFSANASGIPYEITGTPSSRAALIQTIDFSAANLTTTPVPITGLDGYAALRYVLIGAGTSSYIECQIRPSGGAFVTGASYNYAVFSNIGELADTRDNMTLKWGPVANAAGLIYGFGINSLTALTGNAMGSGANQLMGLETSQEAIMDAIQIFTDTGTISTGTLWLIGEKKAA